MRLQVRTHALRTVVVTLVLCVCAISAEATRGAEDEINLVGFETEYQCIQLSQEDVEPLKMLYNNGSTFETIPSTHAFLSTDDSRFADNTLGSPHGPWKALEVKTHEPVKFVNLMTEIRDSLKAVEDRFSFCNSAPIREWYARRALSPQVKVTQFSRADKSVPVHYFTTDTLSAPGYCLGMFHLTVDMNLDSYDPVKYPDYPWTTIDRLLVSDKCNNGRATRGAPYIIRKAVELTAAFLTVHSNIALFSPGARTREKFTVKTAYESGKWKNAWGVLPRLVFPKFIQTYKELLPAMGGSAPDINVKADEPLDLPCYTLVLEQIARVIASDSISGDLLPGFSLQRKDIPGITAEWLKTVFKEDLSAVHGRTAVAYGKQDWPETLYEYYKATRKETIEAYLDPNSDISTKVARRLRQGTFKALHILPPTKSGDGIMLPERRRMKQRMFFAIVAELRGPALRGWFEHRIRLQESSSPGHERCVSSATLEITEKGKRMLVGEDAVLPKMMLGPLADLLPAPPGPSTVQSPQAADKSIAASKDAFDVLQPPLNGF